MKWITLIPVIFIISQVRSFPQRGSHVTDGGDAADNDEAQLMEAELFAYTELLKQMKKPSTHNQLLESPNPQPSRPSHAMAVQAQRPESLTPSMKPPPRHPIMAPQAQYSESVHPQNPESPIRHPIHPQLNTKYPNSAYLQDHQHLESPNASPGRNPPDFLSLHLESPNASPGRNPPDFLHLESPNASPGRNPPDFLHLESPNASPGRNPPDFLHLESPNASPGRNPPDFLSLHDDIEHVAGEQFEIDGIDIIQQWPDEIADHQTNALCTDPDECNCKRKFQLGMAQIRTNGVITADCYVINIPYCEGPCQGSSRYLSVVDTVGAEPISDERFQCCLSTTTSWQSLYSICAKTSDGSVFSTSLNYRVPQGCHCSSSTPCPAR